MVKFLFFFSEPASAFADPAPPFGWLLREYDYEADSNWFIWFLWSTDADPEADAAEATHNVVLAAAIGAATDDNYYKVVVVAIGI